MASRRRRLPPPTRTSASAFAAATLPLLLRHPPSAGAAHVPFGWQSDSRHSVEFRSHDPSRDPGSRGPSSYAGAVRYDPLHHALYLTGATYASAVFDGVDVFALTTEEEAQLKDEKATNDGYWWDDMQTGLRPHLEDPGVPDHAPERGDCFYAVLGLPNSDDPSFPRDENRVKLVHSRRFGSEGVAEACSAVDVLPASPMEGAPGGYLHEFETAAEMVAEMEEHSAPPPADSGDSGDSPAEWLYLKGDESGPNPQDALAPTSAGVPTPSPVGEAAAPAVMTKGAPAEAPSPVFGGASFPGMVVTKGAPAEAPSPAAAPGGAGDAGGAADATSLGLGAVVAGISAATGPQDGGSAGPDASGGADAGPRPAPAGAGDAGGFDATAAGAASPIPAPGPGMAGPVPAPGNSGLSNTGPQSRFRALGGAEAPSLAGEAPGGRRRREGRRPPSASGGGAAQTQTRRPRRSLQTDPIRVNEVRTRSVRLLMAGHVESPAGDEGYVVDALEPGTFDPARVYAFAQQVDVRLPAGELEPDDLEAAEYALHSEGTEEDAFAMEHGVGMSSEAPREEFERIVTSGVESRALLNEDLPPDLKSVYPVALAADATSEEDYYVLMLASEQEWANQDGANDDWNADPTAGLGAWTDFRRRVDAAQGWGRPRYGVDFRVIVKKMAIESDVNEAELTAVDLKLAATSYSGRKIAMRTMWSQEFEPDSGVDVRPSGLLFAPSGDPTGKGDALVVVGTTAGDGDAFGGDGSGDAADLDGFVTKIEADGGEFAGRQKFDSATNTFRNTYSKRLRSDAGQTEVVAGACARPLRSTGTQDRMTHVYVVGSTSALIEGADPQGARLNDPPGIPGETPMEAFLMKVDLGTMSVVWTQQVGAFVADSESKGSAFGYGCAVTRDGRDVYLVGLVGPGAVVVDFADLSSSSVGNNAEGGTDVFVASYSTDEGARNYLRQVGSTRDDFPSRGRGAITTDRYGNAILTGSTRGSLMRRRSGDEYQYGPSRDGAASDVFVMSLERATGNVPPVMHDGVDEQAPRPDPPRTPVSQPVVDYVGAEEKIETENGAGGAVGVVLLCLGFMGIAIWAYIIVTHKMKTKRNRERALMDNNANLHNTGTDKGSSSKGRSWGAWGLPRQNNTMDDFANLNIMVEVRHSASGGWHGVYDDEQLQAIDFGVPSTADDNDNVVGKSLFMDDQTYTMEDGLKEIEDSLDNYEIGEMDDVSDEDLIKAYNEAMALDLEPENEDVEFTMAGIGSATLLDEDNEHEIT